MSGGQLMAGVGQCERIGSWEPARPYWGRDRGYYRAPDWRTPGFERDD